MITDQFYTATVEYAVNDLVDVSVGKITDGNEYDRIMNGFAVNAKVRRQ